MYLDSASKEQLQQWETEALEQYTAFKNMSLSLDITRGKPSAQQLDLSNDLDGILQDDFICEDGTDARNYGGIEGITEIRRLGAEILGVKLEEVIAGGNASLTFMYQCIHFSYLFGFGEEGSAWRNEANVKFLCPVPGYDRHFAIGEEMGFEMVNIPMTSEGPDMDVVEKLVASDRSIKGMWCVPKYSNPTGTIYSDDVVARIAKLGSIAAPNFRVFWDNAYAVHDLAEEPRSLACIIDYCREYDTVKSVFQFASTSKITHAGAGVSFFATSEEYLTEFKKHLFTLTIGPDKVSQLRHARKFPDLASLRAHMQKHAEIVRPKFAAVIVQLETSFSDSDIGSWESPEGGYFVSFDSRPGLATEIVKLAAETGVKLTPAGSTFPYKQDPDDKNVRLAPTLPKQAELETAMEVFIVCVKLASIRQQLAKIG